MKAVKNRMEKVKSIIGPAIIALMFSGSTLAMEIHKSSAEEQCKTIASEIIEVLESNRAVDFHCQADVLASSVYVKNASLGIKNRQYQKATLDLLRSEELLQNMQLSQERCAYFAPILKTYIPKVKALKAVLDEEVEHY